MGGPRNHRQRLVTALAVLVFFGFLDLLTTYLGLRLGLSEANPFGAFLLRDGFAGLLAAKAVATILVALIAWAMLGRGYGKYATAGVWMGVTVWGLAVTSNTIQLLQVTQ